MLRSAGRALVGVAVAALTCSGAVACGSVTSTTSSLPPPTELTKAVDALYDSTGLTFTLRLDTTAARLQQLQGAQGGSKGHALSDAQAHTLAGSAVVFAVTSGKGTLRQASKDPAARGTGAFSLAVNVGGAPGVFEFRYVNKTLYARADAQALSSYSPGALGKLGPAAGLLDGRWLSLPAQTLSGLLGAAPGTPAPGPAPSAALPNALAQAFAHDVQVTRVGNGARGDHLVLTGSTRAIARDLAGALSGRLGALPGGVGALPGGVGKMFDAAKVPDKIVHLDAYVQDGALRSVSLDLAQFANGPDAAALGNQPLRVELDIARNAHIVVPPGATPLDLTKLLGSLGGLRHSAA